MVRESQGNLCKQHDLKMMGIYKGCSINKGKF